MNFEEIKQEYDIEKYESENENQNDIEMIKKNSCLWHHRINNCSYRCEILKICYIILVIITWTCMYIASLERERKEHH